MRLPLCLPGVLSLSLLLVAACAVDFPTQACLVHQVPPSRVNSTPQNLNAELANDANAAMQQPSSRSAGAGESTAMYDLNTAVNAATAFMLLTSNVVSMWIAFKMHRASRRSHEIVDEEIARIRSSLQYDIWNLRLFESQFSPIPAASDRYPDIRGHMKIMKN